MKIGLLVRADNGGLGAQTWELWRHLRPYKTMVVDISGINGYENHPERYKGEGVSFSKGFPTNRLIDAFLQDLDVVMTIETPYNYYLFDSARVHGVKTVLQYNHEFLDYLRHPEWPKPDLLLAPSWWNYDQVAAKTHEWGVDIDYLHVPTNRKLFPFDKKKEAKNFLHIAGHNTFEDRNGTATVYAAVPLIKSDIKITIRSQYDVPKVSGDHRVTIDSRDYTNYWEIYRDEDVLLLPRRYGGLSLQLNEALSLGMIPLMSRVSPQDTFLHPDWLIDAYHAKTVTTRSQIDVYNVTPEALAEKIDWLAGLDQDKIQAYSSFSDIIATERSWENMAPKYIERLEKLCRQ